MVQKIVGLIGLTAAIVFGVLWFLVDDVRVKQDVMENVVLGIFLLVGAILYNFLINLSNKKQTNG